MPPPIARIRFRSLGLALLALATVGLIYADAEACGVLTPVSNRMRYHAIPVALSQLYHGRPHDYTAYRSIALPFQGDRPLQELIAEFSQSGAPAEGTYYWAADDRGLSDYVYASFALFGPEVASFGKLYVLLLLISSLLFLVAFWGDTTALALLVFTLCAVDVLIRVLVIGAAVSSPEGVVWKEPVGLIESRTFDMLSFVAFLHFVLFSSKRRPPSAVALVALVLQAVLFVLLYHARSSLGWQVAAVGTAGAVYAVRSIIRARSAWFVPAATAMIPVLVLAVGLTGLSVWKTRTYHPRYFEEQGARTFWHNALMGFSHPEIRARYGTTPDDRVIIDLVLRRMRQRNDPRLTAEWDTDTALGSLGGHATFDWVTYERAARETYWFIWARHPAQALSNYLFYKPASVAAEVAQVTCPSTIGGMGEEADAFRYLPFRWWPLLLVLAAIGFVRREDLRGMMRGSAGVLLLILPFSLIPAVAFYPAIPTMMGFLMTLTLATYLGLAWVMLRVRERVRLGAGKTTSARQ
jgi:hypothetical protein